MILKYTSFVSLFLTMVCCGQSVKDCSEFGNYALIHLQSYYSDIRDTTRLHKALIFSDKAIMCDTTNVYYRHEKFTALYLLGRYRESLPLLDKMYKLTGYKDTKIFAGKGLVYEQMGLQDSAKIIYTAALLQCDQRLKTHPPDSISLISDKFYIIAIDRGKEYALREFDKRYSDFENETLSALRIYLRDFDKKRILFAH